MNGVAGDSSRWSKVFPPTLIPKVLDLVLTGWESFDSPDRGDHEVPITRRFRSVLRQLGEQKRLPVLIDREIPEDDEAGEERGRIDLRFLHGYRADAYLAFECKRLNAPKSNGKGRSTLAPSYVADGMMRFVKGQYATSVKQGGMIGYVMDGKTQQAVKLVHSAIKRKSVELKQKKPFGLSSSLHRPADSRAKETYHKLARGTFRIHHLFLTVP
jgi:hypothetical protein